MGLVDYSDSESDSEPVAQPAPTPSSQSAPTNSKRPFQKVVDRAKPGKILVNLPQNTSSRDESKPTDGDDAPPTKRARIAGKGGGAFSGFNSFLPPPKDIGKKPGLASGSSNGSAKPAPRPGINLKTGATPGFSRETNEAGENGTDEAISRSEDAEPTMKQPSIPAEQKPAEEVKLVGKPLMFRPLSVARKPNKKGTLGKTNTASKATTTPKPDTVTSTPAAPAPKEASPPPKKKEKISLFSIPDEQTTSEHDSTTPQNYPSTYEPMFETAQPTPADEFAAYDAQNATTPFQTQAPPTAPSTSASSDLTLDALATSMNLSAAARRELFGRGGTAPSIPSSRIINFDTDREYAHNEALRASGQLQPAYNPVRAIAPGKHSLRQLVSQAQTQRDALEESFATGKGKRNEAGAQYGWR
ncbi:mitotic checkpoint regulator, MAD2B-interacting-domain-containing protein [Rostrohypoxylon terebratum]|nr:mitotic checkpoint regulator, MAD2B-interacting-domain-containing protein [Rostrohypoxylon terebratum]